jgi:MYXO-CTERM domain-containing protein
VLIMQRKLIVGLLLCSACEEGDTEALESFRENMLAGADADAHGEFQTRIWSMLDGSKKITHHLVDYEARIDTQVILEDGVELQRDAVFDAWGEFDADGALRIDSYDVVQVPLIDYEPRDPRRIATILVQWEGHDHSESNEDARRDMYTDPDSTNVYYAENSYGMETMSGDTFGPYTITDPGGCNTGQIEFLALDALEEHGHDADKWRQFMFYFETLGDCGFGGLAQSGSPDNPARSSWYNGQFDCVTRNQELGHNYGMNHSHRYDCVDEMGEDTPFSSDCAEVEYGDIYDPMGSGCGHINAPQKVYMGWLRSCNVVTGTSNGTFNLLPMELPCDGPQAVRFPTYDGRYYWLEYRTPRGHAEDSNFEGVVVRVSADTAAAPDPFYLDLGSPNYLVEGASFTDPEGVVTFSVLEMNGDHAVIEATFPEPSGDPPECLDGTDPGMEDGHVGQRVCLEEPYDGDMEPPQITLTFPEDQAWYEPGSDFMIEADVSDDRVIVDVELYYNGEKLFRITEPPWQWEVTDIPAGDYEFGAIARDSRYATPSNAITVHIGEMPTPETTGDSDGSTTDPTMTATDGLTGGASDESSGDEESDTESTEEMSTDDKGCACSQSGRSGAPGFALLILGLAWARRRRAA